MNIIREIRKSNSRKLVLEIPEAFIQKNLEILIIPINESVPRIESLNEEEIFDDLTYLAGTWSNEDSENFHKSIDQLNQIDESLWQ